MFMVTIFYISHFYNRLTKILRYEFLRFPTCYQNAFPFRFKFLKYLNYTKILNIRTIEGVKHLLTAHPDDSSTILKRSSWEEFRYKILNKSEISPTFHLQDPHFLLPLVSPALMTWESESSALMNRHEPLSLTPFSILVSSPYSETSQIFYLYNTDNMPPRGVTLVN